MSLIRINVWNLSFSVSWAWPNRISHLALGGMNFRKKTRNQITKVTVERINSAIFSAQTANLPGEAGKIDRNRLKVALKISHERGGKTTPKGRLRKGSSSFGCRFKADSMQSGLKSGGKSGKAWNQAFRRVQAVPWQGPKGKIWLKSGYLRTTPFAQRRVSLLIQRK